MQPRAATHDTQAKGVAQKRVDSCSLWAAACPSREGCVTRVVLGCLGERGGERPLHRSLLQ